MTERASLDKLLTVANEVREAGGGAFLDALMPAIPQDSENCLIALNMNFNCRVEPSDECWQMVVEDAEIAKKISEKMGWPFCKEEVQRFVEPVPGSGYEIATIVSVYNIDLPAEIGQIAHDFDTLVSDRNQDPDVELLPYVTESVREAYNLGTVIDGKLVL